MLANSKYRQPVAALAVILLVLVLVLQVVMPRMGRSLEVSYDSTNCWTGTFRYVDRQGTTCSDVISTPFGYPFVINNAGNNALQNALTALVDFFPAILLAIFLMSVLRKRS